MTTIIEPFRIGQSVRIVSGLHRMESVVEIYTVLRRNETDSPNPSYVLQKDGNQHQRREFHDQLVSAVADTDLPGDLLCRQEAE